MRGEFGGKGKGGGGEKRKAKSFTEFDPVLNI